MMAALSSVTLARTAPTMATKQTTGLFRITRRRGRSVIDLCQGDVPRICGCYSQLDKSQVCISLRYESVPSAHAPGLTNLTVEDRIVEGERIAVRWTMHGTHQGDFQGIPPTGKAVTVTGIAIHRFAGAQIQESWDCYDALGLLQQLGAIPPAGAAAG